MIIEQSHIQLSSQRNFVRKHESSESLRAWVGNRRPSFQEERVSSPTTGRTSLLETIRPEVEDLLELSSRKADPDSLLLQSALETEEDDLALGSELRLFKMLMEKLLKKKIEIKKVEPIKDETSSVPVRGRQGSPGRAESGPARQGFGLEYDYHESHYEAESTSFAAEGVVQTKDGREIRFKLGLDMQREFRHEEHLSVRMGDALVDPLVLNFDGDAARLTDTRFTFDLDADGEDDSISFLSSNSGFLAFDRNGDGSINDGSELFGPTTGDGFAELAAYDEDGNRFIDEGDAIYNQLGLYNKNAAGEDELTSLREKGVGAIYLDSVSTEFSLNDAENEQKGQIRASGIYLEEDGGTGTVQHVDLSA